MPSRNMEDEQSWRESPVLFRHDPSLTVLFSAAYALVFLAGLVGNSFVVMAVMTSRQLRTTTDYLISSLALADLLIIIFCLPTTLYNNLMNEWGLGSFVCKASTWINSATSCASVYTLVAVTADRYFAICHTLKYALWEPFYTIYAIVGIWVVSGLLSAPNLINYEALLMKYPINETTNGTYTICQSVTSEQFQYVVVNLSLAFVVPFVLISVSYTLIFLRVSTHKSLAVDAQMRDERVKLRVAHMMLTVIVVFALCWVPLYGIYFYFIFIADNQDSVVFYYSSLVVRPVFQWLSLLSSSLNPLIYIAYSQKYRRAAQKMIVCLCGGKYERVRGMSAVDTSKKFSTLSTTNGQSRRADTVDLSDEELSRREADSRVKEITSSDVPLERVPLKTSL